MKAVFTTMHVAPLWDDSGPECWVAVARYEAEGEDWRMFGAGATQLAAFGDMLSAFRDEGFEPSLSEARDPTEVRGLKWSVKSRFAWLGTPVREVCDSPVNEDVLA